MTSIGSPGWMLGMCGLRVTAAAPLGLWPRYITCIGVLQIAVLVLAQAWVGKYVDAFSAALAVL